MPPDEWFALSKEEQKKEIARRAAEREKAADADSSKKSTSKSKAKDDDDDDDAESVASLRKELNSYKSKLKATTSCLLTTLEVNEELTDEEGSNSLLMAELRLQQASPQLGAWYAQVEKSGRLEDLNLRDEWQLDSQTTHNLCCNKDLVYDIRKASKALNMSGNGGSVKNNQEGQDSRSLSFKHGTSRDVV